MTQAQEAVDVGGKLDVVALQGLVQAALRNKSFACGWVGVWVGGCVGGWVGGWVGGCTSRFASMKPTLNMRNII